LVDPPRSAAAFPREPEEPALLSVALGRFPAPPRSPAPAARSLAFGAAPSLPRKESREALRSEAVGPPNFFDVALSR